jgi:hypothetical protein
MNASRDEDFDMPNDPSGTLVGGLIAVWAVVAVVGLAATIFWIVELIDVLRREFADSTLKVVWLLVVFFLHGLGALLYYFIGKPQGRLPGRSY